MSVDAKSLKMDRRTLRSLSKKKIDLILLIRATKCGTKILHIQTMSNCTYVLVLETKTYIKEHIQME
jgi:hypothetical protein